MALSLRVPKLEEKPLIIAEVRPHKVLEFVGKLPMTQINEAASTLLDELEILNRQRVDGEARFKALEAYRPTLINLCESLSATYINAALPLSQSAKDRAVLAESLWREMAYGYKLALLDVKSYLFNLSGKKPAAFAILRAIESAASYNLVRYQTYSPVPEGVWSDVHQMYYYAVQESIHTLELDAGHPYAKTSSIDLVYREMLLMVLADPQHLNPPDIALVADYTARYASKAKLQGLAIVDNFDGVFLVSLDSDTHPIPYLKNINPTNKSSDILLITVNLARLIHQHINALKDNTTVKEPLPAEAKRPGYIDILLHLIKYWGAPPKRVFGRTGRANTSDIGVGIATAHYFINGERVYLQPLGVAKTLQINADVSNESDTPAQAESFESARWSVVNISAGGIALRELPTSQSEVRVGELLSLRNTGDTDWSVAVIRWAVNTDGGQIEIGTQLISPKAIAGGIRRLNQGKFVPTIILPASPALKQEVSIVAACGTYSPARILELDEDGTISKVMATRLVERTSSFERFLFSVL